MRSWNSILLAADRILIEGQPPDQVREELERTYPQGLPVAEREQTLEEILRPECSIQRLGVAASLLLHLLDCQGAGKTATQVYLHLAKRLTLRSSQENLERRKSLELAALYYECARAAYGVDHPDLPGILLEEGEVHKRLAELGVDSPANQEKADLLFAAARGCSDPQSPEQQYLGRAGANARLTRASYEKRPQELLFQAVSWLRHAAQFEEAPQTTLGEAVEIAQRVRGRVQEKEQQAFQRRTGGANTLWLTGNGRKLPQQTWTFRLLDVSADLHYQLALSGIDEEKNLQEARALCAEARAHLAPGGEKYKELLLREIDARTDLGRCAGVQSLLEWQTALELCNQGKQLPSIQPMEKANLLLREAFIYRLLSDLADAPGEQLDQAFCCCQEAIEIIQNEDPESFEYGKALIEQAEVCRNLAGLGHAHEHWLERTIFLCQQVAHLRQASNLQRGAALLVEANAWQERWAEGETRRENLRQAIQRSTAAREWLPPTSHQFSGALHVEAEAQYKLSKFLIDPNEALNTVINLCGQARERFASTSLEYGGVLLTEGNAHLDLSKLGRKKWRHLDAAESLYLAAEKLAPEGSQLWGDCVRNRAFVLRDQGQKRRAYELLKVGLEPLEKAWAAFRSEERRAAFVEVMSLQYVVMVELCLELAEENPEEHANWCWEGWHWVHQGKNRTLLTLLANLQVVRIEDPSAWKALDPEATRLDQLEREHHALQFQLDEVHPVEDADPERQRVLRVKLAEVQAAHFEQERKYRRLRDKWKMRALEAVGVSEVARPEVAVPPPQEVAAQLRQLAGVGDRPAARPLLAEYFFLQEELVVFLLPLWGAERAPEFHRISFESLQQKPASARPPTQEGAGLAPLLAVTNELLHVTQGLPREQTLFSHSSPEIARPAAMARIMERLELLIRPVASLLGRSSWQDGSSLETPTEFLFSPHYLLNLMPLHGVPWNGKPLIAHLPVTYLPASALAEEIADRLKRIELLWLQDGRGTAFVVGEPNTDEPGVSQKVLGLKHAGQEARLVAERLEDGGHVVQLVTDAAATTQKFLKAAPDAWMVHFAGHSTFDTDFQRSGLELGDRRLTVFDLEQRLELKRTLFAYLSSCDSARAIPGRADALLALARAFLSCGVPTVLASLWPVNDEEGKLFAEQLYELFIEEKLTLGEAFQRAVLARMGRPGHEKSALRWAPFMLMGAWNTRAPLAEDL